MNYSYQYLHLGSPIVTHQHVKNCGHFLLTDAFLAGLCSHLGREGPFERGRRLHQRYPNFISEAARPGAQFRVAGRRTWRSLYCKERPHGSSIPKRIRLWIWSLIKLKNIQSNLINLDWWFWDMFIIFHNYVSYVHHSSLFIYFASLAMEWNCLAMGWTRIAFASWEAQNGRCGATCSTSRTASDARGGLSWDPKIPWWTVDHLCHEFGIFGVPWFPLLISPWPEIDDHFPG